MTHILQRVKTVILGYNTKKYPILCIRFLKLHCRLTSISLTFLGSHRC